MVTTIKEYFGTDRSVGEAAYCRYVYGNSSITTTTTENDATASLHIRGRSLASLFSSLRRAAADVFLPIGYPHSVRSPQYIRYQFYDSVQALCSYLRGVACTRALLSAAGVGDAAANATSSAIVWVLRDGLGMIGGLAFSFFAAPAFDGHVKEFRLAADIFNDVGLTIDLAMPYVLGDTASSSLSFLCLAGLSTMCKVMCGIAAGATKASITAHFAIRGNMADLNAKEGAQETLVNLIGMYLGVLFIQSVGDDSPLRVWASFALLTAVHVWANYRGVALLRLATLNRARADLVFRAIARSGATEAWGGVGDGIRKGWEPTVPRPEEVMESVFASVKWLFCSNKLRLGVRIYDALPGLDEEQLSWLSREFDGSKYLLGTDAGTVNVTMKVGADHFDVLKGYIHGYILLECLLENQFKTEDRSLERKLLQRTRIFVNELFEGNKIQNLLSDKGWDLNNIYLGCGKWRAEWEHDKNQ